MSESIHVQSIQAIVELKNSLKQFQHDTHASLDTITHHIRRFQERLEEREYYWRRRAENNEENSEAWEELEKVRYWKRKVTEAVNEYQRQAYRLGYLLNNDVPKAGAFLGQKIAQLDAYRAEQPVSGTSVSISDSPLNVGVSPTQVASARIDSVINTVKTASLFEDLTHIVLYGIDWLARFTPKGNLKRAIGDAGEDIATYLLSEKCGFQEVPFDQPYHGFDRVFAAPGLPLIIVESKVNPHGLFRPGNTQQGEQDSPEWIQAHAEDMANLESKKWSPANEEIAKKIQELGAENIPIIAVVTQTETGDIDIYYRPAREEVWQQWNQDIPLAEALGSDSAKQETAKEI